MAMDGSVVDSVAAWAVALRGEVGFALNVDGEGQSPHRAEVEGLMALALALDRCDGGGVVHILADCQSALATVHGGGALALLGSRAKAAFEKFRDRWEVRFWWVPSHGRVAPAQWRCPPCGEMRARALNAHADRRARECAARVA